MDAVRAADRRRILMLESAALQRRQQFFHVGDQNIGRARELNRETSIEDIRRGEAKMHKTRLGPDNLAKMGEESDDVVLYFPLDRIDARNVEFGVLAFFPDFLRGFLRNHPEFRHRISGMCLDLEPDAEAGIRRPDRGHFRPGITRDHQAASPRAAAAAFRMAEIFCR